MSLLLTPAQVAEQLGVSAPGVIALIRAEELRAVNVARSRHGAKMRYRIRPADLEAFLAGREIQPKPKATRRRNRPRRSSSSTNRNLFRSFAEMTMPQTINDLTPAQRQQLQHRLGQLHMAITLLCEPWRDDMPDIVDELRRDANSLVQRIEQVQHYLQ